MKLSKKFTTVTPFSKTLALILFIALPLVTFCIGLKMQFETSAPVLSMAAFDDSEKNLTREFNIGSTTYILVNKYMDSTHTALVKLKNVKDNSEYVLGDGYYGSSILSVSRSPNNLQYLVGFGQLDAQHFELMSIEQPVAGKSIVINKAKTVDLIPDIKDQKVRSEQVLAWADAERVLVKETLSVSGQPDTTTYWLVPIANPKDRKQLNL